MTHSDAHIDFETTSGVDLREAGVYRYAADPSTAIMCMGWKLGTVRGRWFHGAAVPPELREHAANGGRFVAWNAPFETEIWNTIAVRDHGFPRVNAERWHNPQAHAMQANLPGSLDGTAAALNSPTRKDTEGKKLMLRMSAGKDITAANLRSLADYCMRDVDTEVAVSQRLLHPWPAREREIYRVSEKINRVGVAVDVPFARLAAKAAADYQHFIGRACEQQFGIAPTQVQRIVEFCGARRVPLPDLKADTVDEALEIAEFLPEDVVTLLRYRQQAAMVSPKKYAAILRSVSPDGRLRGMFAYAGAGQTTRWSGRIVQLHNFPRPTMPYERVRKAMEALRREGRWECLLDYGDPLEVLLNALRPTLVPGRDAACLTSGDESQIEARVLPWLAGDQPTLDVFRRHEDVYLHSAESIYHRPVTKADKPERQIGKVATLALGFGGGKDAFRTMGRNYGVKVTAKEADEVKKAWRAAHPPIPALWAVLEVEAFRALDAHLHATQPGNALRVRAPEALDYSTRNLDGYVIEDVRRRLADLRVRWRCSGGVLRLDLPSGRSLSYNWPGYDRRVQPKLYALARERGLDHEAAEIDATRVRLKFRVPQGEKMIEEGTYGGKLAENITQAVARDVLAEGMLRADADGVPLVMHVHDELVAEGDHTDRMRVALTTPMPWDWTGDLPLAADVATLDRYHKED